MFKEWLIKNWDELRKGTKMLSRDENKDIANHFYFVDYSHEKPCDSFDRLFALYLIDEHADLLNKSFEEIATSEVGLDFTVNGIHTNDEKDSRCEGTMAYDNYEREGLPTAYAWKKMIEVARKGREAVLNDSYDDGGWFGAS